ncbi:hypothetical protein Celaphus_00005140 [Cervus elaphus hippelaphus]|uniref:Ig-like domain-containing protein n=1 Tax=Cervus elaphus hippelaphus TaxID=46360 RepID=A0A212CXB6_CEREH|nr:hypothetical protein Celaphus_00005140 [Cervus elaphus hippelaphus]
MENSRRNFSSQPWGPDTGRENSQETHALPPTFPAREVMAGWFQVSQASHLADDCLLLPSNALLLEAPSPQDSAQFECVVSNEVGEARKLYWVMVHGVCFPRESSVGHQCRASPTGSYHCLRALGESLGQGGSVEGRKQPPSPFLVLGRHVGCCPWPFQILSEGSLRIQPVLAQDAGHYLCLASNPAGSDRQGRDLRVFGR